MRVVAVALLACAGCQQQPLLPRTHHTPFSSSSSGGGTRITSRGGRIAASIFLAFTGAVVVGAAAGDELKRDDDTKPGPLGRVGFGALGVALLGLAYVAWPAPAPDPPSEAVQPIAPVQEHLDRAMVAAGVARMRPLTDGCVTTGEVRASVSVAPDGTVSGVRIVAASDDAAAACVANAMRSATFERTQRGGSFAMPFTAK